jgi:hypothetical protein
MRHAEGGGENRQVKAGKRFTKSFTEETFQNPTIKTSYPTRADCVPCRVVRFCPGAFLCPVIIGHRSRGLLDNCLRYKLAFRFCGWLRILVRFSVRTILTSKK